MGTHEATLARGPGRPRSDVDTAILQAALDLLIEDGFQAMSVEGVAARAGVGKATIYRRWPSKEELVTNAMGVLSENIELPDTGTVRDDLIELARRFEFRSAASPTSACFARMANDAKHNPVLGRLYVDNVLKPRRKLIEDAISRGMERGELRADLDLEVAVDVVVAPFVYRKMLSHLAPQTHRHDDAAVVDAVLSGLSVRGPERGGRR